MSIKNLSIVLVFLTLALTALSAESADPEEIDVGDFINRVVQGEDFSGQQVLLTGVALGDVSSGDRLLNIGTLSTYSSGAYENYVSVYDTTQNIRKGSRVVMLIEVESSSGYELGGKGIVLIEAVYQSCQSC